MFRTSAGGDPLFSELLRRERETALEAFEHRDAPFEKVVEALRPDRRFGRHPLFQILFLFEGSPEPAPSGGGFRFGLDTLACDRSSYWDLELSVADGGEGGPIDGLHRLFDELIRRVVRGSHSGSIQSPADGYRSGVRRPRYRR